MVVMKFGRALYTLLLAAFTKITITRGGAGSPCAQCNCNSLIGRGFKGDGTVKKVTFKLHSNSRVGPLGPTSCATVSSLAFLFRKKIDVRGTGVDSNTLGLGIGGSDFSCVTVRFQLREELTVDVKLLPFSGMNCGISRKCSRASTDPDCAGRLLNSKNLRRLCTNLNIGILGGLSVNTGISCF